MRTSHACAVVALLVVGGAAAFGGTALSQNGDRSAVDPESSLRIPGSSTLHRSLSADGADWRYESFRTVRGERCSSQNVPGEGVAVTCFDRAELLAREGKEVLAFPGARQQSAPVRKLAWDNLWINGFVSGTVASLEVVNVDCSVVPVPFDDEGGFMHVVGSMGIRRGVVPYRLVARDSTGALVHDQDVRLGPPANGRAAGVKEVRPALGCR